MVISVELADPRHSDVQKLLRTGHAAMQAQFPAKRHIPFSIEPLLADGAHVFVARAEGCTVGCCALFLSGEFAELKKLYVARDARRQGAADHLVAHVEAFAKGAGFEQLKLETGVTLTASHRLYARRGYSQCEAFGDHLPLSESLFLTKRLTGAAAG
jgi:putative acetyltransferase